MPELAPTRFVHNLRACLIWLQYLLLAAGLSALGYCAFVLTEATIYQSYESWFFEHRLLASRRIGSLSGVSKPPGWSSGEFAAVARQEGFPFGRLEIPRLKYSMMVFEGDDSATLHHGVGHIPGTALPGARSNVGLAGHRDTFFRRLQDLRVHDQILLTTLDGVYRYRITRIRIVQPEDIEVLKPTGAETLTLVTCYPFHFIGSAPQRFIVQAQRSQG